MDFDGSELDFWLGEWDATWGEVGHGTNRLTRILGGKVIDEHFLGVGRDATLEGRSWSVFDPEQKVWRQTWVDDSGGYIDLVGERADGSFAFGRMAPELGETARQRMVFRDISPDAFRWTWETSLDGGSSWEVRWDIAYRRSAGTRS